MSGCSVGFNFKFEMYNSVSEVSVAPQKVLWPPDYPSLSSGLLETWRGPMRGQIAQVENNWLGLYGMKWWCDK
jgi:hypothetical protein